MFGMRRDGPFVLASIVDAEHAWVRFTRDVVPEIRGVADSILVSTTWRSFHTPTVDAGMSFQIRIASPRTRGATVPSRGMLITRCGPYHRGVRDLAMIVEDAPAIGLFEMTGVRPGRDSVGSGTHAWPTADLSFRAIEVWKGSEILRGDTIAVFQEGGVLTDTTWRPTPNDGTPLGRGWRFVLFLRRGFGETWKERWTFDLHRGGYSFVIGERVFSRIGLGDSLRVFRDDVLFHVRNEVTAGRGLVAGALRRADNGAPVGSAEVWLRDAPQRTVSAASGRFELEGVPIGHRTLVVKDGCGEAHATVEVTDERIDSLDVVLSCPEPVPSPSLVAGAPPSGSERRILRGPPPRWPLHRIDLWPMLIRDASPAYPPEARRRGFEGDVHVRVWIDSLGMVRYAKVDRSVFREVDESAEACVESWRFRPALENGRPIPCTMGVTVHFAHPRSGELIAFEDIRDTASTRDDGPRSGARITVEASATFDSITRVYRYRYRLMNLAGGTGDLAAFALMPLVGEIEALQSPPGWNGFIGCGERRDVIGCQAWGDSRARAADERLRPGEALDGFAFESRHPPGSVRWFAQVAGAGAPSIPWRCSRATPPR
jgi:TonB family protein